MRWLRPMPVRPAITAGFQAPLGVIETTQPSASAATTDVVPAWKASSYVIPSPGAVVRRAARCASPGTVRHASSRALNGFVPPWKG